MGDARSTILLVDNDAPGRYVTGRILRGAGHEVKEAASSAEALAAVAVAPPDLVLLDIRLPALGGAAVLERIKANPTTATIPVVYLSASFADDDSVVAGLDEGADAYLIKPVSPRVLLATVKAALRVGRLGREVETARREAEQRAEEAERVQAALRESEERHRLLFETMQEGMQLCEIITDAQGEPVDFRYLEVNPVAARVFGRTPEDLAGRTRNEVLGEPDPKWLTLYGEVALTGKPASAELYSRALGRWFEVQVYSPQPRQFVSMFMDTTERKQAQELLALAHQRLQWLMEAVPVGISFSNDPQAQYIVGNAACLAQFEMGPEDNVSASALEAGAAGRQVRYFQDGQELAGSALPLQRAIAENAEIGPITLEVLLPSGRRWTAQASGAPVHDLEGNVVGGVAVTVDVTAQRQHEGERERLLSELRRQQAFLDSAMAQLPAGVVIAEAPSAKVILGNEEMVRIWRRPVPAYEDAAEYGRMEGFHPDGSRYAAEEWPLVRAIQKGETVTNEEINIVRGDGSRGVLLSSASPIHNEAGEVVAGVVISSDITDLKRVQREVERLLEVERARAREARLLETILENTPSWLAYLDRDLRYLDLNAGYAAVAGLERAAVIGRAFSQVFPESDDIREILEQVRDTGKSQVFQEFPRVLAYRPELGQRSLDFTITPVKGESGEVEGLVISVTDVTESVRARERAVAAERARAELAENLNDEIAHRVKNNLAMISGLLQMQMLGQQGAEVAAVLRDAITRVRTFANIHEQMYSSRDDVIDLAAVLHRIAESTREIFASRREVVISVTGHDLLCSSRVATNLSVVANELLTNALKYGAPGGNGELHVKLSLTRAGDRLGLVVWNSGNPVPMGFDAAQRQRMGLRVVQDIVEGYGGTFSLSPEENGTRAEVRLELGPLTAS